MSVNLLIKRCIKWISRSVCVLRRTEDPGRSSTSKRNHPITRPHVGQIPPLWQSCCHLHSAAESQNQKAGTSKKLPRIFFLTHHFISVFPTSPSPPTPNHQPSGLACHCWVSHSPSEGPPFFFFSSSFSLFFWGICHFIRACRSHQSANFIVQMGSGGGQLPGFSRKERPWPGYALRSARPYPTLGLSSSWASPYFAPSGPERLWRSATYLRGHLALHRGWDILYKSPCHLDSD